MHKAIETEILPQHETDSAIRERILANGGPQQLAQGATLGWGDEAQASIRALLDKAEGSKHDYSDLYQHYHAVISQATEDSAKDHPVMAGAIRATGAAAGLATTGLATALGKLGGGSGLLARMGIGAGTGAALGTAQGAGDAQPGQVAEGAGKGAAWGAAFGAGAPVAGDAATALLRAPINALANYVRGGRLSAAAEHAVAPPPVAPGPTQAQADISRAIQEDNTTPDALKAQMLAAQAAGKPAMISDFGGPNMQGLGRGAVVQPGPARAAITTALDQRATPQAVLPRVTGDATALAGAPDEANIAANYGASASDVVPNADALLTRSPVIREAFDKMRAQLLHVNPDEAPLPLFEDVRDESGNIVGSKLTRPATVRDIDLIKKYNDARLQTAGGPMAQTGDAAEKAVAGPYTGTQKAMLAATDAASPTYAAAREEASRHAALREIKVTLSQAADRSKFPDLVKPIAGTSDVGAAATDLEKSFGNGDALQKFLAAMDIERKMTAGRNFVVSGSNTANKLADQQGALEGVLDSVHAANGGMTAIAGAALKRAGNAVVGRLLQSRNSGVADALYSTDGQKAQAFLDELDRIYKARLALQKSGRSAPSASAAAVAATSPGT
jgi:hypothetical protein